MKVLIAEDDPNTRLLLDLYTRDEPFKVEFCSDGTEALERVRSSDVDVVVSDVRMPGMNGDALLRAIKMENADLPVVLMTAHSSVDDVVEMMKQGADDYIPKPVGKEEFLHRLRKVMDQLERRRENALLRGQLERAKDAPPGSVAPEHNILGNSGVLRALLARLPMAAKTDAPVMVLGESGTGKELVANAIHNLSRRARGKMVAVNCGALPDTLLESELFGYKRGAFTDAHRDTPGLVEAARGGTLFLDEIGDVSLPVQVKLLRFLQTREFKPLGSPQTLKADVRIVTATHRDLPAMIAQGRFREDLYYRLNIVPLTLPPLRAREGDVTLLAHHFFARFCAEHDKPLQGFSDAALRFLEQHDWPGNIRELENRVQQAVVLCAGVRIEAADLGAVAPRVSPVEKPAPSSHAAPATGSAPPTLLPAEPAVPLPPPPPLHVAGESFKDAKARMVNLFERNYVERMLRDAGGNISVAARRSGLDRKSFFLLLRKHGVNPATFGSRAGRPSGSGSQTLLQ